MLPHKDKLPITNDNQNSGGGESSADYIANGRWKRFKEFMSTPLSPFASAEVSDGTKNDILKVEETCRDDVDVELGRNGVKKTSRVDEDVESGENGRGTPEANQGKDDPSTLLVCLKWGFYILNFMLVLLVFALDLISPENNSTYYLLGVVISSVTLVFGIIEIGWRAKQEEVKWRKKGKIYWFYYKNDMPFGTSADIIGLVCSCVEFIMETVSHFSKEKFKDKHVYTKLIPVVLAFFLFVTTCLKDICAQKKYSI